MTTLRPPGERMRDRAAWMVAVTAIVLTGVALLQPAAAITLLGVLALVAAALLLATGAHALIDRIRPAGESAFEERRATPEPTAVPGALQTIVSLTTAADTAELPGTIRLRIHSAVAIRLRTHHALDLRNAADRAAIDRVLSPLMRAAVASDPDAPRLPASVLPHLLDELEKL